MELIIKVDEKRYEEIKQIANAQLELKNKTEAQIIANGTPYNPAGDAISREDLINAKPEFLNEKVVHDTKYQTTKSRIYAKAWNACNSEWLNTIKNAPTVDIKDEIAGAYNEGYMCGNKEAEKARPQGERIKGFIDALDKAFLMFDANCVYSGERVLQILEKLKWLEKLKEEKGGTE